MWRRYSGSFILWCCLNPRQRRFDVAVSTEWSDVGKWSRHSRGRVEGIQEKTINRESRCRRRHLVFVGRDSSVGIATRYGLDGLGIECRWRRNFPHPSIPALGLSQPPIQWVPGLSPVVKRRALRVAPPPTPSSSEIKERVELYLYSPSGPLRPVT